MEQKSLFAGFPGLLAPKLAPRLPQEAFRNALGALLEGNRGDKKPLVAPWGSFGAKS